MTLLAHCVMIPESVIGHMAARLNSCVQYAAAVDTIHAWHACFCLRFDACYCWSSCRCKVAINVDLLDQFTRLQHFRPQLQSGVQ